MLRFIKRNALPIALMLVFLWAAVIFAFSAADATDSSKTSTGVTHFLCSLLVPDFNEMSVVMQRAVIRRYGLYVRKAAHFTEYMIFGVLLYTAAYVINRRRPLRYAPALAWLVGTLYAVSDECHQYFVPGRSMQLRDMLIDSFGTLTGIGLGLLLFAAYASYRAKRHGSSPNPRHKTL